MASGTTKISEKIIAASTPNLSTGCKVTSAAISGFVAKAIKDPAFARTSRYSGKIRPAWRITQTGTRSTGWPNAARISKSFCNFSILKVQR